MEIYEIKNLNCISKEERKILLKEVMDLLHLDEKPTKEELKMYCKKAKRKYKFPCNIFKTEDGYQLNIQFERGIYSIMECYTMYEAMCKYLLFIKAWNKYKKMQVK